MIKFVFTLSLMAFAVMAGITFAADKGEGFIASYADTKTLQFQGIPEQAMKMGLAEGKTLKELTVGDMLQLLNEAESATK